MFLAQAGPDLTSSILEWIQFGAAGLVVIAFLAGWMVPGWIYKHEQERRKAAEDKVDAMHKKIEEELIPLLVNATNALTEATGIMQQLSFQIQASREDA